MEEHQELLQLYSGELRGLNNWLADKDANVL